MDKLPQNIHLNSLWKANEKILDLIKGATQDFAEAQYQPDFAYSWKLILNVGFLISLNKFEAILILTNPINGSKFHMEAASLSRDLWEIWATLGWLGIEDEIERSNRLLRFKNETNLNQDQINLNFAKGSGLPFFDDQVWLQEQGKEIRKLPKNMQKLPSVVRRMEDIAKRDHRFKESHEAIYTIIYKQFSGSVHFTGQTIIEHKFICQDFVNSNSLSSLGRECLDASGGFFILITELWNNSFQSISEFPFREWQNEWKEIQSQSRKGARSDLNRKSP